MRPESVLAGIPRLVDEFGSLGLRVRFADRTAGRAGCSDVERLAFELVERALRAAHAQHVPGQVLHLRVRVDDGFLVLSMQTTGATAQVRFSEPDVRFRGMSRAPIEAAGGRIAARRTCEGNWLVIVHLPLQVQVPTSALSPYAVVA